MGILNYGYDAANRRTSVSGSFARTNLPQPVASASYDPANELKNWGTSALTYDNAGNLLNDGANSVSGGKRRLHGYL